MENQGKIEKLNRFTAYYEKTANKPFKRREMGFFAIGGVGDALISSTINTFFMIFATTVMQISPLTIGTVLLITKFVDAFVDPVVGVLVDNTRSRYGRLRPYILIGGIFWAIMTALLFYNPGFTSQSIKIAYVFIVYILWGIAFSSFDVPYWSFSAVITTDTEKRNSIVSITRAAITIGAMIVSILGGILISVFAKFPNSGGGYSYVAWIFAALAAISFIGLFFNVNERVKPTTEKISFKSK